MDAALGTMIGYYIGITAIVWVPLLIVLAILAFLTPFFILKIRNQVVQMNKKFDKMMEIVNDEPKPKIETQEIKDETAPW